jgi:hypothetical protein
MRVLLPAYGSCGSVDPVAGHAVRVCAPPDRPAAEGWDALVATGVTSAGVWR